MLRIVHHIPAIVFAARLTLPLPGFASALAFTPETCFVTTVAGSAGEAGYADGTGTDALFGTPQAIATDGVTLYVADSYARVIRSIHLPEGRVATLAGVAFASGHRDGTAFEARFATPAAIVYDRGSLYVADSGDHTIRRISIPTAVVATIAGSSGKKGFADGTGTASSFSSPSGIAYAAGRLLVADTGNHCIRDVDLATGAVTTIAGSPGKAGAADGTGPVARFNQPTGLGTDGSHLYVADSQNHTIRMIDLKTGSVTTIAGSPKNVARSDGRGTAAGMGYPQALLWEDGCLYVFEGFYGPAIRRIDLSTLVASTVAGFDDTIQAADGTARDAGFRGPSGAVRLGDSLYITDVQNRTVRRLTTDMSMADSDPRTVTMRLVRQGAVDTFGQEFMLERRYDWHSFHVLEVPPTGLRGLPSLAKPLYSALGFKRSTDDRQYVLVIDEPAGAAQRVYFDANGNGSFSDDPPVGWTTSKQTGRSGEEITVGQGSAWLNPPWDPSQRVHLLLYRDPRRWLEVVPMNYVIDYYREGEIVFGSRTVKACLFDLGLVGDFRGARDVVNPTEGVETPSTHVFLGIDFDGDGTMNSYKEVGDVRLPFLVDGAWYAVSGMTPSGDRFTVSRRSAAAVLYQSVLSVLQAGEAAPPLALRTVDGSLFSFPSPGGPRILLIYFWNSSTSSTQIGLARDAYSKLHAKGLEVLGVNVDYAGIGKYLSGVLQKANMPWPVIYDGRGFRTPLARQYGRTAWETNFVVAIDGMSGKVIDTKLQINTKLADAVAKLLE